MQLQKLAEKMIYTLKGYIDYMASINHPLSIPAVKAFAWTINKRSSNPNRFNREKEINGKEILN